LWDTKVEIKLRQVTSENIFKETFRQLFFTDRDFETQIQSKRTRNSILLFSLSLAFVSDIPSLGWIGFEPDVGQ